MPKLNALKVQRAKPGRYGDGGNLYLQVSPSGTKSWIFRYRLPGSVSSTGKRLTREMGLGALDTFTLAEARERAREQRQLLAKGLDPIEQGRQARQEAMAKQTVTFAQAVERYLKRPRHWHNDKHGKQWASTLKAYAFPVIGHLDVRLIDQRHILQILEPVWHTKNETASRVRGRIEQILDWAKVHRLREGENPARFKGNLDHALPARGKVRTTRHHPAMPHAELPAFMSALVEQTGPAALALRFTILTASRTGEVIGMRWGEVDLDARLWTIPGSRMKGKRDHQVPLSDQAVELLTQLRSATGVTPGPDAFVFAGTRPGKPMSDMGMLKLIWRMGREDITIHGFRSSFRVWSAEETDYPREVAEAALAHIVADKTEAAYQRSTFFEKRRRLMDSWSRFCTGASGAGEVIRLRK
jgi:integrase